MSLFRSGLKTASTLAAEVRSVLKRRDAASTLAMETAGERGRSPLPRTTVGTLRFCASYISVLPWLRVRKIRMKMRCFVLSRSGLETASTLFFS